jgi:sialate O-acetylesterase
MIQDWRAHWNQGEFPFMFVQLANFRAELSCPVESKWAELREAQTMTLRLPNTGMAVAIDAGDAIDIHPVNKQDIGLRLALNALAITYGQQVPYSGPMLKSVTREGDKLRIHFDHINGGLQSRGEKLQGFILAGTDRKFAWAQAAIDGDTVIASSPEIAEPAFVRYAWADNPACNLYNDAGLPAVPFRSDMPGN